MSSAGKLAILVGGGPAPGINAVISSATIKAINEGFEVLGVQDGFKWLVRRDVARAGPLSIDGVSRVHLRGGSILGTARENPTRSEETMRAVIDTLKQHGVTHLVTIGGDDTALSSSTVAARSDIRTVHVPKTIDNDLPLPAHVQEALATVRQEDVARAIVCSADPARHLGAIQRFADMGYDHVYIHQIGPRQDGFFDFYRREVLEDARAMKVAPFSPSHLASAATMRSASSTPPSGDRNAVLMPLGSISG